MFMGQIIRKILEHISYAIFLRIQCRLDKTGNDCENLRCVIRK
jgi:hypothetical protein